MALAVNRVTNANVYDSGNNLLGRVSEFDIPGTVFKMAEHSALGMVGMAEYFSGIEKMEATLKWAAPYREIYTDFGNPFATHQLQLRANIDAYEASGLSEQTSCVIYLTAQSKGVPGGSYKQHENPEMETGLSVTAIKVEFGGVNVFEFDATANILKVNGVDVLTQYRSNIGA